MADVYEDVSAESFPGENENAEIAPDAFENPEPAREQVQARDPKEQAFLSQLHQRKVIADALKAGKLSCLPGADGYADTAPAVNLANGTRYHGATLLQLKEFQREKGFPTAEYVTQDAIQKSGVPVQRGKHGVGISFSVKNEQGVWEHRQANLFNVAQTAKPWKVREWAAEQLEEQLQKKQDFLKTQFGESYQPKERSARPGPEITCTSTDPEKYLGEYLAAVSMGGKFKASGEQAAEFGKKFEESLFERGVFIDGKFKVTDEQAEFGKKSESHTNPFKLTKICNAAGEHCKAVCAEIRKEQKLELSQKQEQTRGLGR
ncbi:MAG: ssDNA-binding domain-containing protein [Treponema sp.]|jgi:hypothetical protein|nr:ssDNA-binding domain-containing protein [Treponema sp.]